MSEDSIDYNSLEGEAFFEAMIDRFGKDHGMKIITPKTYDLPQHYYLEQFHEEDQEVIQYAIDYLEMYLHLPIIKDNFRSRDERNAWRKKTTDYIRKEYGDQKADGFSEFLGNNKMKSRNKIANIYYVLEQVYGGLWAPQQAKAEQISTLIKNEISERGNNDPWEGPTSQAKIDKVDELSNMVVVFLNSMGSGS